MKGGTEINKELIIRSKQPKGVATLHRDAFIEIPWSYLGKQSEQIIARSDETIN